MLNAHPAWPVAIALLALAWAPAAAQDTRVASVQIYQQRMSDGSIVLTDRPVRSAQTQRIWEVEPEDAAAARQRSERVRLEAQTVSERIQRRIDGQQYRTQEREIETLRSNLAEARRDAEAARQPAVVIVPQGHRRFDDRFDQRFEDRRGERPPVLPMPPRKRPVEAAGKNG